MGLVEAILLGLQFKRLEKPIVFFAMLAGLLLFSFLGLGILAVALEGVLTQAKVLPVVAAVALSVPIFALAWLCGHLLKKCFT